MRLMIVQYGDYYGALKAREAGMPEEYRAQYYSLDAVDSFLDGAPCLVLCLGQVNKHEDDGHASSMRERRHGAYRIIDGDFMPSGSGLSYHWQAWKIAQVMQDIAENFAPTHLIIRTSGWVLAYMGRWALEHNVALLPLLADYVHMKPKAWHGWRSYMPLPSEIAVMQDSAVPLVCNHNYPASRSLVQAGVPEEKVVPWDWPAGPRPHLAMEKKQSTNSQTTNALQSNTLHLLYAGLLRQDKGVGDLLHAMALCRHMASPQQNYGLYGDAHKDCVSHMVADIYGDGPDALQLHTLAESLGLYGLDSTRDAVRFHGNVAHAQIQDMMHKAHLVVVPSRHAYPEGLPNVIYEALEAYTPLVISNHPSFLGRLQHGEACYVVDAGNPVQLAKALTLLRENEQRERLSQGIVGAWEGIQCPVRFADVLMQWRDYTLAPQSFSMPCLEHSLGHKREHSLAHLPQKQPLGR